LEILIFAGLFTGVLSGFFGIGGGTILVPFLMFIGYDIKGAIGISVLQMLLGSLYGSYVNSKKGLIDLSLILPIGIGGFIGALGSELFVENVSSKLLETMFLLFVVYAFYRVIKRKESSDEVIEFTPPSRYILVAIGVLIGFFAISIGVGGSLLLVPILVGFFHYNIKKAIATGLFFVIFSSLSGVITFSLAGMIPYYEGLIIGLSSIIGVRVGIWLGHLSSDEIQKNLLLIFYVVVALFLAKRTIFAY
jgi:uncharacterized membrane protein YfcA